MTKIRLISILLILLLINSYIQIAIDKSINLVYLTYQATFQIGGNIFTNTTNIAKSGSFIKNHNLNLVKAENQTINTKSS